MQEPGAGSRQGGALHAVLQPVARVGRDVLEDSLPCCISWLSREPYDLLVVSCSRQAAWLVCTSLSCRPLCVRHVNLSSAHALSVLLQGGLLGWHCGSLQDAATSCGRPPAWGTSPKQQQDWPTQHGGAVPLSGRQWRHQGPCMAAISGGLVNFCFHSPAWGFKHVTVGRRPVRQARD